MSVRWEGPRIYAHALVGAGVHRARLTVCGRAFDVLATVRRGPRGQWFGWLTVRPDGCGGRVLARPGGQDVMVRSDPGWARLRLAWPEDRRGSWPWPDVLGSGSGTLRWERDFREEWSACASAPTREGVEA